MKLINSTDWPDWFLRRMVSWCCRELDISPKAVRQFKLRNRSDGFTGGHCYSEWGNICVSLGILNTPTGVIKSGDHYRNKTVDDLVRVTAHEVAHRMSSLQRVGSRKSRRYGGRVFSYGGSERQTVWHENKVMENWTPNRERLMAEWLAAPQRQIKPERNPSEVKLLKAQKDFARWTRKLKLAQGKVKKYQRQLKRLTAVPQPNPPRIETETARQG